MKAAVLNEIPGELDIEDINIGYEHMRQRIGTRTVIDFE